MELTTLDIHIHLHLVGTRLKGASTKNFRHACLFWPLREWDVGLDGSVEKEIFVTKMFFQKILNQILKSCKKNDIF